METKIGVFTDDFVWGGGIELIRIIVKCLSKVSKKNNLKIFLFVGSEKNGFFQKIHTLLNKAKLSPEEIQLRELSLLDNVVLESYEGLNHKKDIILASKHKLDVLLPIVDADITRALNIALVGYIYDFQHRYLKSLFNKQTIDHRDKLFKNTLDECKSILVNAEAVKNDIGKFYGKQYLQKVFVMPFAGIPEKDWFSDNYDIVRSKYNLPEVYFLISNQLWVHKSHSTAFKAMQIMQMSKKYKNIHLVCTGNLYDSRFPNFYNETQIYVNNLNMESKIHFLGYIPKNDQVEIMKHALCVLQPTLFEGGPGGGSVYNAISMGLPVVVSDIPINRELPKNSKITYFRPKDSKALANIMKKIFNMKSTQTHSFDQKKLMKVAESREEKVGEYLYKAIQYSRRNN